MAKIRLGIPVGKYCVLILAATIVALMLRLPRLDQRPMHGDEAVHADKFRLLLEEGVYEYDPNEYHGPTLNYLTLIPARLAGAERLAEVSELTLRIVPVFFGVCLVLLLLMMIDGLGPSPATCAAILTAISPAMVFYSRYYIQETLLVCFTFGVIVSGYRYTRSKNIGWALLTGIFIGLMHATKETSIIAFGSMLLALLGTLLMRSRGGGSVPSAVRAIKPSHLIAGFAAGAIVSGLLYSSFMRNPGGILDSVSAYAAYFNRAGGDTVHIHPWHYYLRMLIYYRYGDGPIWTEGLIVILAVIGFIAAMTRKGLPKANVGLLRFVAFYTLILTAAYSAIPYKTPWCMLGFLHGMILLAGVGAVVLVRLVPNVLPRLVVLLLLFDASMHLTWQAYLCNYRFYADSRNPYVYAHPTVEVFSVAQRVEEMAEVLKVMAREQQDKVEMQIQVICPGHDYWPLPWYLRKFEEGSIGWWDHVDAGAASAPLIIASPNVEAELANKLYVATPPEERQIYLFLFEEPYYVWLRPKVKLLGFVRKDLWDRFQLRREELIQVQTNGEK